MVRKSLVALARRLRRDERGVALVEMALSVPLLMLLCLGMIDVSRLVAAKLDLEQAAQQTTDFVLAKRPTNSSTAKYVTEAANAAGVRATDVTVTFFLECDGVRQASFDTVCPADETLARYALVSIKRQVTNDFNWSKMASFFGGSEGSATVEVVGDSTVRFQ